MRRLAATFALIVTLSSVAALCGTPDPGQGSGLGKAIPTYATRAQPNPSRQALVIQFCNDDTGSYPRNYFVGASKLMASSLVETVTANQQGVTLFATAITHNTFDPSNTLSPAFTTPSIPAYSLTPTPVPTLRLSDPFTDPPIETAIANKTAQGIVTYNTSVTALDQTIAKAKSTVAADTKRLTAWNPPVDYTGTSILGCFKLAAERFQGISGTKMIYIASDLENTTDIDYTQSFVTSHSLAGVIVHVIFFYNTDAAQAQQKKSQWCPYLKSAGAKAVVFNDPASSPYLSDVFVNDAAKPTQSCS